MSFDHLDLVTVLGQVLTLDEQPAGGKVTFDTTVQLVDLTTGQAIFPVPLTVTLDGDGTFTIDLPATDDPDLAPTGWTYQVNVDVVGSKRRSFPLSVPHGTGPLELFLAAPVATSPGVYITRGPQGDPGPAGPAGPAGDLTMTAATAAFQTKADAAAQSATYAPKPAYYAKADGGCKGDGTTDDTAAISAAMDAAHTAGKTLWFEAGNYLSATITKSYALAIASDSATITVASSVTNGWLWTFQGSIGSHASLTGNMAANSPTLPVSTTGMAVGSILLIGSNVVVLDEAYPATVAARYVGQLSEVRSVDSGSQATVSDRAYTAFNTTDSAFAAIVTPIVQPSVRGLSFVNPYRATKPIGFLSFIYAQSVDVDIRGDGASASGVSFTHCYRVSCRSRHRNYRDDSSGGYYGYGVLAAGSTAHGEYWIDAVGGTGNAFNTSGIDNDWGEPIDHIIHGSASGGSGGFSTHPAGRDITFEGCHVTGLSVANPAFALRCDGVRLIACTVDRAGGGVYLYDNARNISIRGCKFRNIYNGGDSFGKGRGVNFAQSAAAGDRNIVISDNEFDDLDGAPIFLSDNAADLRGVGIINNHFKNYGKTGAADTEWSAIYSQAGGSGMLRWTIKGNRCSDSQGTPTSKYLFNCNGASGTADIMDNVVSDGIQLTNHGLQGRNVHFGLNVISGKQTLTLSDYTGISTGAIDCLTTDFFYLPLTANRTLSFTNPTQGQVIELHIGQDATGSRLVTWPTIVWPNGGSAPACSTSPSVVDIFRFRYRGTSWYSLGYQLADAAATLTALGLGSAATQASSAFDAAGVAAGLVNFPWQLEGWLGWTFDRVMAASSGVAPSAGQTMGLLKIMVPQTITVTNVVMSITVAGATLTAGTVNVAALYDSSGNRLSSTADQATAWQSTGDKVMALGTPQTITGGAGHFVYVGFMATGTTLPLFQRGGGSTFASRFGRKASTDTAPPATIAVPLGTSGFPFWAALS